MFFCQLVALWQVFKAPGSCGGLGGWTWHHLLKACEHRWRRWVPWARAQTSPGTVGGGKSRATPLESLRVQDWNHWAGAFLYGKLGHFLDSLLGTMVGKTRILVKIQNLWQELGKPHLGTGLLLGSGKDHWKWMPGLERLRRLLRTSEKPKRN